MPTARDPVVAVIAMVPLFEPDEGLTASQLTFSLAFHASVPPPVLLMLTVWAAGLPAPCVAVNERLVGLTPIAGGTGAAVIVNVTGTVTVVAPVALSVMAPLRVLVVREAVVAVTVIVPLPVPEAGVMDSQLALSLADHAKVPPPVLLMLTV